MGIRGNRTSSNGMGKQQQQQQQQGDTWTAQRLWRQWDRLDTGLRLPLGLPHLKALEEASEAMGGPGEDLEAEERKEEGGRRGGPGSYRRQRSWIATPNLLTPSN
jgi:hypothetical protein